MAVYVVQAPKPGPKGFTYDISPVLEIGVPTFIFLAGAQPSLTPGPSMFHALKILENFNDQDCILWAGGDPAGLAMVSMIAAAKNNGRLTFLRWERERDRNSERTGRGYYVPVKINLYGKSQ